MIGAPLDPPLKEQGTPRLRFRDFAIAGGESQRGQETFARPPESKKRKWARGF